MAPVSENVPFAKNVFTGAEYASEKNPAVPEGGAGKFTAGIGPVNIPDGISPDIAAASQSAPSTRQRMEFSSRSGLMVVLPLLSHAPSGDV
jgi:hypothetical protein